MKLCYIELYYIIFCYIYLSKFGTCTPITNTDFNEHIREFSLKDDINTTEVKTLQRETTERYSEVLPIRSPVKFKDQQDSSLSGSSYSRGLLHHDHPGYALHDYEEPHFEYGTEHHFPDHNHHAGYPHGIDHHGFEHHGGHPHPDYHKYHYPYPLAAKSVLWPIAGLALLGAAAALVTNPILLQIGVASGKRRRRDTEEILERDVDVNKWTSKSSEDILDLTDRKVNFFKTQLMGSPNKSVTKRLNLLKKYSSSSSSNPVKTNLLQKQTHKRLTKLDIKSYLHTTPPNDYDSIFIPVPIKLKDGD